MNKAILGQTPTIEEDFEKVFKEQFPPIYNYIYYHIHNATDAEDLTADVFVRAYKYWGSYCPEKGNRSAWLGGIARNIVRTYFQKNAHKPRTIELSELICADAETEGDYMRKEELRQIFAQIDALPEHKREIITMKYLLRLTNRDIARIMDMSESNVGVALHRIIKSIQKNLKNSNDWGY